MPKYTRGEFLGFGAALAGAFRLGPVPAAQAAYLKRARLNAAARNASYSPEQEAA